MRVVFLQHQSDLRPGILEKDLRRRHHAVTAVLETHEVGDDHPELQAADLVVSLGSQVSVYRTDLEWVACERRILSRRIAAKEPVLGICFGAQMIASLTGGSMIGTGRSFVGWMENDAVAAPLWKGPWFRFHKEQCTLPTTAEVLAQSGGIIQAFQLETAVGVQFHPEMDVAMVEELAASIQRDFGMTAAATDALIDETRQKMEANAASREALLDEILKRLALT